MGNFRYIILAAGVTLAAVSAGAGPNPMPTA
jgi:hypothetical protein